MTTFEGRVAIVTGAGRGLGRAYAHLLTSRGAHVVVNDSGVSVEGDDPDDGPARTVAEEIDGTGGTAVANCDSVAEVTGARAMVDAAIDRFGRLDIVVNNAGVLVARPIEAMTRAVFELHFATHLAGSFTVTQAAWPHLVESDAARVVNTVSSAMLGMSGYSAYGPMKTGVVGLTRALAVEGRPFGIGINAIAPAAATRMLGQWQDGSAPDAAGAAAAAGIGAPELVAPVVAHLASAACTCTGEVIMAGGGRISRLVFAETRGVSMPEPTLESVAAAFDQICDDSTLRTVGDTMARATRSAT